MEKKRITAITLSLCIFSVLTACGDSNSSKENSQQAVSVQTSINDITTSVSTKISKPIAYTKAKPSEEDLKKYKKRLNDTVSGTKIPISTANPKAKTSEQKIADKTFNLYGKGININLDCDWTLIQGGTDDNMYASITEYPAVLQYKTKTDTCNVVVADGSESEEEFASNNEESYISAYGASFDSIDIVSFENLEIDGLDSYKIIADVSSSGKKFKMMHILSNSTVKDKTISIMFLDNSGSITELYDNFEEKNIYYSDTLSIDHRSEMHQKLADRKRR